MDCLIGVAQQGTCSFFTVLKASKCCHVNAVKAPVLLVDLSNCLNASDVHPCGWDSEFVRGAIAFDCSYKKKPR